MFWWLFDALSSRTNGFFPTTQMGLNFVKLMRDQDQKSIKRDLVSLDFSVYPFELNMCWEGEVQVCTGYMCFLNLNKMYLPANTKEWGKPKKWDKTIQLGYKLVFCFVFKDYNIILHWCLVQFIYELDVWTSQQSSVHGQIYFV